MACCTNTIDLGCFDGCGSITIDNPDYTGSINIDISSGVATVHQGMTATAGTAIEISLANINENSCHTMKIYDSNGDVLVLGGYDCFQFKTKIINRRYEN